MKKISHYLSFTIVILTILSVIATAYNTFSVDNFLIEYSEEE